MTSLTSSNFKLDFTAGGASAIPMRPGSAVIPAENRIGTVPSQQRAHVLLLLLVLPAASFPPPKESTGGAPLSRTWAAVSSLMRLIYSYPAPAAPGTAGVQEPDFQR